MKIVSFNGILDLNRYMQILKLIGFESDLLGDIQGFNSAISQYMFSKVP